LTCLNDLVAAQDVGIPRRSTEDGAQDPQTILHVGVDEGADSAVAWIDSVVAVQKLLVAVRAEEDRVRIFGEADHAACRADPKIAILDIAVAVVVAPQNLAQFVEVLPAAARRRAPALAARLVDLDGPLVLELLVQRARELAAAAGIASQTAQFRHDPGRVRVADFGQRERALRTQLRVA